MALPALSALLLALGAGSQDGASPQSNKPVEVVATRDSYPDDPRLDVALEMLRQGAFEPAVTTTRTVLKERPDVERAQALLGIALNKLKRYEEARAALETAAASTQRFPEQRHAAHFLGWSCFHLGELERARLAFESHLKAVPDEPDSTFGLALIALNEDRLDESEALFDKALKGFSEPKARPMDQARVLTRMADLALRRDDVAKAESLLDRAIKATPMQHETWAKLARVKDRLGKTSEADGARANEQRLLEALGRKEPVKSAKPADTTDAPAPAAEPKP